MPEPRKKDPSRGGRRRSVPLCFLITVENERFMAGTGLLIPSICESASGFKSFSSGRHPCQSTNRAGIGPLVQPPEHAFVAGFPQPRLTSDCPPGKDYLAPFHVRLVAMALPIPRLAL
jgi:hypothetical protein